MLGHIVYPYRAFIKIQQAKYPPTDRRSSYRLDFFLAHTHGNELLNAALFRQH
jgi:hypothetical protein